MAQPVTLPPLPFAEGALAPVISAQTIGFHYGKHHKAYVDNLNKLIAGTELEGQSLEAILKATAGKPDKSGIFNNAAQTWNHTFYWNSLKPGGGGAPGAAIAQKIDAAFGSYDKFKTEFANTAVTQRMGLAGRRRGCAQADQDRQCRKSADQGSNAVVDHRRLGARVLPRLPESTARSRQRRHR